MIPSILREMFDDPAIRYAKSGDVHIAYQVVDDGPVEEFGYEITSALLGHWALFDVSS
jgi:hypothetical protein